MSRSGFRKSQRKSSVSLNSCMWIPLKNVFSETPAHHLHHDAEGLFSGSLCQAQCASVVNSGPALQWGWLDFCAVQLCFGELGPGSNTSAPHPAAASINVSARPSAACWEFAAPPDRSEGNKLERSRVCDTVKVFCVIWTNSHNSQTCYGLTWSLRLSSFQFHMLTRPPTSTIQAAHLSGWHCGCAH